jgi:hypothetical protein
MAFTAFKTSGDEVPASYVQALITEVRPLSALKVGDQTVNNSATLVNDANLAVSLAASAAYGIELHLVYNSNASANFKANWSLPAGATFVRQQYLAAAGAATQHSTSTLATVSGYTGTGADAALDIWAYVTTSTTAGTLQLQWAQASANVSDTIVRDGAFLIVRRLS